MPLPKTTDGMTTQPAPLDPTQGATPATGVPGGGGQPATGGSPLDSIGSLLSGSVFGIPTKYLLIGLAAWFFLKK